MRRTTKWAAGAAAVVVPILAGASPAAAASASDSDAASVSFSHSAGGTINCNIGAAHDVDSTSGDLAAAFSVNGTLCRGNILVQAHYRNRHDEESLVESGSSEASIELLSVHDAGSTIATVNYRIAFANCAADCVHTLQTTTK